MLDGSNSYYGDVDQSNNNNVDYIDMLMEVNFDEAADRRQSTTVNYGKLIGACHQRAERSYAWPSRPDHVTSPDQSPTDAIQRETGEDCGLTRTKMTVKSGRGGVCGWPGSSAWLTRDECSSGGASRVKPEATSASPRRNAWGNLSYADLITKAIESSPRTRLTLSQIYEWMVKNVPYFSNKGDSFSSAGWKVCASKCLQAEIHNCGCISDKSNTDVSRRHIEEKCWEGDFSHTPATLSDCKPSLEV